MVKQAIPEFTRKGLRILVQVTLIMGQKLQREQTLQTLERFVTSYQPSLCHVPGVM